MRSLNQFLFIAVSWFATAAFAQNPAPAPQDANAGFLPPNAPSSAAAAPAKVEAPVGVGIFAGFLDPYDYDPRGRRDPFAQPIADVAITPGAIRGPLLPLQEFEVSQLRLTGILWDVRHPKAMFKDPSGKLHIVGPNAKVGPHNGYIAVIREGELVVVETIEQEGRLVSTAQVVKIAK